MINKLNITQPFKNTTIFSKSTIMRKIFFILLSVLLLNCSLDGETTTTNEGNGNWSLSRSVGGVSGTTTNFETDQITWVFNEFTGILVVEHNVQGVSAALDPGTYEFRIEAILNADYIFIDDVEYGAISISARTFTIDQNITSDGNGTADLFEYFFVR
jgi:hypothetical protein